MHWTPLTQDRTKAFIEAIKAQGAPNLFNMDQNEGKILRLPFFNDWFLYRLTNYAAVPIFTLDFIGNEKGTEFLYLDGGDIPLLQVCKTEIFSLAESNILAYIQFYFMAVAHEDGEVFPLFEEEPLKNLTPYEDRSTFSPPAKYQDIEIFPDANNEKFTVTMPFFYDGSYMKATLSILKTGELKITHIHPLISDDISSEHKEADGGR